MAMLLEVHVADGSLKLGPVQPAGQQPLRETVDALVDELVALPRGVNAVEVTEPEPRTFMVSADFVSELGRTLFRRACSAAMEVAEANPRIEWGGPG